MKECIKNWLNEQFAGDEAMMHDVYEMYKVSLKENLDSLKSFLDSGDVEGIRKVAHAVKGIALTVGDEDVSANALSIENAVKAGDFDLCKRQFEHFDIIM